MPSIGVPGLVLVVAIALLLFGPKKLPELGRAVGTTIREFKSGARKLVEDAESQESKSTRKEDME
ncbi:twin-arginine translocase TatA/TatE family subunit [Paenibacillus sp.]|uniref:twin-arginine translocase TatA/TatE family subunit n=1 Tax=Paenibacillus sp. TaxID=58172 RepID=UPI00281173B3|nr:twin-arginine translocase TatA/TatE family subunit [Paenibacillus sp.]